MTWADRYPEQKLVPYDSAWPSRYRRLEADLRPHLGAGWEFEHVGRPHARLVAKPVIDVAMSMPQGVRAPRSVSGLSLSVGASQDRWVTTCSPRSPRTASVLPSATSSRRAHWPEAHVRLFASWLRAHDVDRDRYASLKKDLVAQGVWSSAYTESKGAFVLQIVNHARAELGLTATRRPL